MKESEGEKTKFHAPGTLVLVFIFLVVFIVLYFVNWRLLSELWPVR